ncbi:methyltransferase domain-containing protein [Massilia sp. Se16.2.3]|uniref:spermine/spermidine synthase domain-containing protein n=1 Tax=Massilia sp. Se16.2.3 TaxID=2709303 RepID=UPI0015FEF95E|nr:methyltransferase domain-containing protein [Massilia sp. Se16.2.3]QNA99536.1 methyltransferase domain-containing protein [Massilia sp. Se16.2.3]
MPPRLDPADPPAAARASTALVSTRGNRRTLEFQPGDIQSEMLLSAPHALVLEYARAMMCFALFVPHPRHILMVGLGGGSMVKFCHRHFPDTRITVVEISSEVIALREQFRVPPDDARLRIVHADAADYLACADALPDAVVDVILVDGFDATGMPESLGSERFYADCRRALRAGGVLVANFLSYDPARTQLAARLAAAFGGRVCDFAGIAGNNHLLFAVRVCAGVDASSLPALRMQRRVMRRRGLGFGLLNRLLARAVVAWLAWRPARARRMQT